MQLLARSAANDPILVGLIGCGKFGSMYLSQAHGTPGVHVLGVADLDPVRAISTLQTINYPSHLYNLDIKSQPSLSTAKRSHQTTMTSNAEDLITNSAIDVIIESTGSPAAGIKHAILCAENGKHIIMVNVEADILCGPYLSRLFQEKGLMYSLAYGDQPALICEMVDWARTSGFEVVCAGKGMKYLPEYHYSTPKTVWGYYGLEKEEERRGLNAKMFNSFLDGTKSAVEMGAVANAAGLGVQKVTGDESGGGGMGGLRFPPCGAGDLAKILKPSGDGGCGILDRSGVVETVSCLGRNGTDVPNDLRWGVFVVIKAADEYQRECFKQYGLSTDETGWYAAQYKPYHMIGLELGISVANVMLRGEPTGQCQTWTADVVATAKKDLEAGDELDGEGGFTVYGTLMSAEESLAMQALPIGLAHGVKVKRRMSKDDRLSWEDVEWDASSQVVGIRRAMEEQYRNGERTVGTD